MGDSQFMKDSQHKYRFLLILLRGLVYSKRMIFWSARKIGFLLSKISESLRNTVGIPWYRHKIRLQKITNHWRWGSNSQKLDIIGKREILQFILLIMIFAIMIPHTKLYARDTIKIPGQETLLYKIIGPGEQDFTLEEVSIDYNFLANRPANSTWRTGSLSTQTLTNNNPNIVNSNINQDVFISVGGSAVGRPGIIPGAIVPNDSNPTGRTDVVIHEVKPSETISSIAEQYQIDIASILWANNLTLRSYIRPGDKLKILPTSGVVHTIKKGDTITKIAKLYKTDEAKIIQFNSLKENGADIVIGEELIIPGGTKPQAVVVTKPRAPANSQQYGNYSPSSPASGSGTNYLWPAGVRRITQYFGWRHTGLDIAGPVGTPIYAAKAGRVTRAQCGWNGGYGCYIIIDHGYGVTTLYGHNSRLFVSVGDEVEKGQNISAMGSTGRSTGPHLHFEVRINGSRSNPLQYVR